jgi:hypothetical protein
MEIRPFQIIVLIVSIGYIIKALRRFLEVRVNLIETAIALIFWGLILLLTLLPDRIGGLLSEFFGIKSDVNAILFVMLGLVVFVLFRLYNRIRIQDKHITAITRRLALLEHELNKQDDEDPLRS